MVRKASQFSCSLRGCSSYKLQASEEIFCADLICTTTSYCHHLNVAWMCQEHPTFVTSRSMSFKIFFVLIAEITGYSIADRRIKSWMQNVSFLTFQNDGIKIREKREKLQVYLSLQHQVLPLPVLEHLQGLQGADNVHRVDGRLLADLCASLEFVSFNLVQSQDELFSPSLTYL